MSLLDEAVVLNDGSLMPKLASLLPVMKMSQGQ